MARSRSEFEPIKIGWLPPARPRSTAVKRPPMEVAPSGALRIAVTASNPVTTN